MGVIKTMQVLGHTVQILECDPSGSLAGMQYALTYAEGVCAYKLKRRDGTFDVIYGGIKTAEGMTKKQANDRVAFLNRIPSAPSGAAYTRGMCANERNFEWNKEVLLNDDFMAYMLTAEV